MQPATSEQCTDGASWVVGTRGRGQRSQTLYVWAPTQQLARVERQLGVRLRLGMMDIADLHQAMQAWTADFGATERPQATWEEFPGGARVLIPILMEPSPRRPLPQLLHGVDSIGALAAAVPPGRPVPVLFARAAAPLPADASVPSPAPGASPRASVGRPALQREPASSQPGGVQAGRPV